MTNADIFLFADLDTGPLFAITDAVGLYPPDSAAVASRATACDPGSGPCRIDD